MPYIYTIQNKINLKIYVGQTINIANRWSAHRRNCQKEEYKNYHLYSAMNKYGLDNFIFTKIEELDSELETNDAEIFWIEFFRSWDNNIGYNKNRGGDNAKHSSETKEKMRNAKLGKKILI